MPLAMKLSAHTVTVALFAVPDLLAVSLYEIMVDNRPSPWSNTKGLVYGMTTFSLQFITFVELASSAYYTREQV
jgi:hypothetical protein